MYQLRETAEFAKWLARLRDKRGKARILTRLDACRLGNLGDWTTLGDGLSELRIHIGPGYRIYFVKRRRVILILLCGGSKSSQGRDIKRARELLKRIDDT